MKYKFDEMQLNNFLRISDLALKVSGYKSLDKILYIVNILRTNMNVCELTNVDMTIIEGMFDDVIKVRGLEVADAVLELTNILRTPLPEETINDVDEVKSTESIDKDSEEIEHKG